MKIYPEADRQKGTVKVEVGILKPDLAIIKPEMSVRVSFSVGACRDRGKATAVGAEEGPDHRGQRGFGMDRA